MKLTGCASLQAAPWRRRSQISHPPGPPGRLIEPHSMRMPSGLQATRTSEEGWAAGPRSTNSAGPSKRRDGAARPARNSAKPSPDRFTRPSASPAGRTLCDAARVVIPEVTVELPATPGPAPGQASSGWLRNELPRHGYVSLERPDARARALSDPEGFLNDAGTPVVLDEIQYTPQLLHPIKDRIDADRRPGRYVLTGSQTFALMKGVSQSLAGRVAVLSLDPLSAGEAGGVPEAAALDRLLARVFGRGAARPHAEPGPDAVDWLLRGGYPEPRLDRRVDREIWSHRCLSGARVTAARWISSSSTADGCTPSKVKATETPVPAHAANLATFAALAGPATRAVLACRVGSAAALRPGVRAVPWHLAW